MIFRRERVREFNSQTAHKVLCISTARLLFCMKQHKMKLRSFKGRKNFKWFAMFLFSEGFTEWIVESTVEIFQRFSPWTPNIRISRARVFVATSWMDVLEAFRRGISENFLWRMFLFVSFFFLLSCACKRYNKMFKCFYRVFGLGMSGYVSLRSIWAINLKTSQASFTFVDSYSCLAYEVTTCDCLSAIQILARMYHRLEGDPIAF